MKARRTGTTIFSIGAIYIVIVSWLLSWWYVPAYRELGPKVLSAPTWYGGTMAFVLWAASGPLGAILLVMGASILSGISSLRLSLSLIGAAILTLWLALWSTSSHQPVLFGIGGGLITFCFLYITFMWAKTRPILTGKHRVAADLRIAGYLLFFIAAWGLCGLLGAPIYALRPQLMEQYQNTSGAPDMALKVLVCLTLGWAFIAVSQHVERNASKDEYQ